MTMPRIALISCALLLACGPIAQPSNAETTTNTTAGATTSGTTQIPDPTTTTAEAPSTGTESAPDTSTTIAPNFVFEPDLPETALQCDLFDQDCEPGQKCIAWSAGDRGIWNATRCVDIMGDATPGEPCTRVDGFDDCAFGGFCWSTDEQGHGTCVGQCTGTWDAPECPPKSQCAGSSDGVLYLCLLVCDPLEQDCPNAQVCIPSFDAFLCELDASGDNGQFNDPCDYANTCDAGLLCLNTASASAACDQNSPGCCQPFCEFPDAPCPNPDQQCVQWFDPMMPIPPNYENIGVCAIPT